MVVGGSYVIIKGDQLGEIQGFVCGWGLGVPGVMLQF